MSLQISEYNWDSSQLFRKPISTRGVLYSPSCVPRPSGTRKRFPGRNGSFHFPPGRPPNGEGSQWRDLAAKKVPWHNVVFRTTAHTTSTRVVIPMYAISPAAADNFNFLSNNFLVEDPALRRNQNGLISDFHPKSSTRDLVPSHAISWSSVFLVYPIWEMWDGWINLDFDIVHATL